MATFPDLPTPITPNPGDLPVEPDEGPGTPPTAPTDPESPFTLQPEQASASFAAHRSFLSAAAFQWPRITPHGYAH